VALGHGHQTCFFRGDARRQTGANGAEAAASVPIGARLPEISA
jgi:hypothetical protein